MGFVEEEAETLWAFIGLETTGHFQGKNIEPGPWPRFTDVQILKA
jgi:hypothetical protein